MIRGHEERTPPVQKRGFGRKSQEFIAHDLTEICISRAEKKAINYLGLVQLACGLYWYRRLYRMGADNINFNAA